MRAQDLLTAPFVKGLGDGQTTHCTVEAVGLVIYGDLKHRDRLPCLDDVAQAAVIGVQDLLSDQARASIEYRRVALRLLACHWHNNRRHTQRLALWCARSIEHLAGPEVKRYNDATERYLAGEPSEGELFAAADAAVYASRAAAFAADAAVYNSRTAAELAVEAAVYNIVYTGGGLDVVVWLDRFFDAWQKIAADEGCLLPDEADEEYERVRRDVLAMLDGEQVTT